MGERGRERERERERENVEVRSKRLSVCSSSYIKKMMLVEEDVGDTKVVRGREGEREKE